MKNKTRDKGNLFRKCTAAVMSVFMMCGVVSVQPKNIDVSLVTEMEASAVSFTPRTTEPSTNNSNYYSGNVFYRSGYGMPNCTCYAYGRAMEILGYEPDLSHGNANQWWDYNKNSGAFKYGSTPQVGAIACWNGGGGGYGHVAVIEKVDGDTVWISESNWGGEYFRYFSWNKNQMNSYTSDFKGYIYLIDEPVPGDHFECKPVDIAEGKYSFKNVGNGDMLNYYWGTGEEYGPIVTMKKDGSAEQTFKVKSEGSKKYSIQILHGDGGVVNSFTSESVDSGTAVTRYPQVEDDSERFYFHKEGSYYYIFSAANKDVVFTAGSGDAQIVYSSSSKSNKNQQWELISLDPKPISTPDPVSVAEDEYCFVNVGNGEYMNYYWGTGGEYGPIVTMKKDGSAEQTFKVKSEGSNKYSLQIKHSDGGVVNSFTTGSVSAGVEITRYPKVEDDSERFYFYKVGDNYYIASAANKSVVFTASTAGTDGQLVYKNYDSSNKYQQWKLVKVNPDPVTTSATTVVTKATTSGTTKATAVATKATTSATTKATAVATKATTEATTVATTKPVFKVDSENVELEIGQKHTIVSNYDNLTYRISGDDIIIISKTGVITAVSEGSAIVFAVNEDNETVAINVTVKSSKVLKGDTNCDGKTNIADAVAILQFLANSSKYPITEEGKKNADVDGAAGISGLDALTIQKFDAGVITSL